MTFTDRPNGLPHCPSTRAKYLVRLGSHIEVYINSTSLDVRPRTPARHRSERWEIATHSYDISLGQIRNVAKVYP